MPAPDAVRVTDNRESDRFEAHLGSELAGYVTYRLRPQRITFLHTEVEPALEGHGIGSKLAKAVLDDARTRGLSVILLCPFIASWVRRHPSYGDMVLAWPPATED
jgi:predicted GNAT family acetyltransferase